MFHDGEKIPYNSPRLRCRSVESQYDNSAPLAASSFLHHAQKASNADKARAYLVLVVIRSPRANANYHNLRHDPRVHSLEYGSGLTGPIKLDAPSTRKFINVKLTKSSKDITGPVEVSKIRVRGWVYPVYHTGLLRTWMHTPCNSAQSYRSNPVNTWDPKHPNYWTWDEPATFDQDGFESIEGETFEISEPT